MTNNRRLLFTFENIETGETIMTNSNPGQVIHTFVHSCSGIVFRRNSFFVPDAHKAQSGANLVYITM